MKVQFRVDKGTQTAEVIRENDRTVIVRLREGDRLVRGKVLVPIYKAVKRHRAKHHVKILRGRKALDMDAVEKPRKRKELEL